MKYLFFALLAVNLAGAAAVVWDKHCAKQGRWRVRERTFFIYALLGAVPGVYGAMRLVRHKTLHKRFMLGLPAIFILQIVIIIGCLYLAYKYGILTFPEVFA